MDALQGLGSMAVMQMQMPQGKIHSNANMDKTAKDFESMFMSQMLQPMFQGVGVDPIFGGGHGEEIMRTFLVQEYGKVAARDGRLGVATAVKNEMLRAQAAASSPGGLNAIAK